MDTSRYDSGGKLPAGSVEVHASEPEPVLTADQYRHIIGQHEPNDFDLQHGYRTVVDEGEALNPDDPNSASGTGEHVHANLIGDVSDEDLGIDYTDPPAAGGA